MNLVELISELGSLTVLDELRMFKNLSLIKSEIARALPVLPPIGSGQSIRTNIAKLLNEIPGLRKKKRIVLAGPELMILELLKENDLNLEVLIAVDSYLTPDKVDRISDNIPSGLLTKVVQIPEVPFGIKPANAIIIAVGFNAGLDYALITRSTHNILNFYKAFYFGEIVLIDPLGYVTLNRPSDWVVINKSQIFTQHISVIQKEAQEWEVSAVL